MEEVTPPSSSPHVRDEDMNQQAMIPPLASDEEMEVVNATGKPQQQHQGAISSTSSAIAGDSSFQKSSAISTSVSLFDSALKGVSRRRKSAGVQGAAAAKKPNDSVIRRKSYPQWKQQSQQCICNKVTNGLLIECDTGGSMLGLCPHLQYGEGNENNGWMHWDCAILEGLDVKADPFFCLKCLLDKNSKRIKLSDDNEVSSAAVTSSSSSSSSSAFPAVVFPAVASPAAASPAAAASTSARPIRSSRITNYSKKINDDDSDDDDTPKATKVNVSKGTSKTRSTIPVSSSIESEIAPFLSRPDFVRPLST